MPTQLSYLLHVKSLHEFGQTNIRKVLLEPYDSASGFGFSNFNLIDENNISCSLIYSSLVKEKTYDISTSEFISVTRTIYANVYFELDFINNTMVVRGGTDKIKRLVNVIGFITQNKLAIDPIFIDIYKVINFLRAISEHLSVTGLIIKNYRPVPELSGRFAARVQNLVIVNDVLQEYGVDVSEFTCIFETEGEEITLRISNTGALAINSSETGIRRCLDLIKDFTKEAAYA